MNRERLGVIVPPSGKLRFTLADLQAGECKWPVHETRGVTGGHLFCAEPVIGEGKPYCKRHTAMATGRVLA